jgi:hypothetical protein
MPLLIRVKDDGEVLVSIKGVIVQGIKSLTLNVDEETSPIPHIVVVLQDPETISDSSLRVKFKRALMDYKMALAEHPLIHVVGYRDTLPTLPAVVEHTD